MSEPVDLQVVRVYEKYGIRVIVAIDFIEKEISIVERKEGKGHYQQNDFEPKSFQFQDRGIEYLNGWIGIFRAMEYAVTEAKKELEAANERDLKAFMKVMIDLSEIELVDNEEA